MTLKHAAESSSTHRRTRSGGALAQCGLGDKKSYGTRWIPDVAWPSEAVADPDAAVLVGQTQFSAARGRDGADQARANANLPPLGFADPAFYGQPRHALAYGDFAYDGQHCRR